MSLNHFTSFDDENKWMAIKCYTLSFGAGQLKTQATGGNFTSIPTDVNIVSSGGIYYTCDQTSLRIKSELYFITGPTLLTNTISFYFDVPGELFDRFTSAGAIVLGSGYIAEYPSNLHNTTALLIVTKVHHTRTIECMFNFNQDVYTSTSYKAVFDISIFKQG